MVRTMSALMRRQGYNATGLNQIAAESGAPKGSIYFHFPGGKEQLAAEAIATSGEGIRRVIQATLSASPDAATAVRTLATGMAAGLAASSYSDGCPIATVALLRAVLVLSPPLNYALALTSLRFFDHLLGSALGLVVPIGAAALLSRWIAGQP